VRTDTILFILCMQYVTRVAWRDGEAAESFPCRTL
jgi:hypothetical protein